MLYILNLSYRGAVIAWFSATALAVGLLLQNPFALVAAAISISYLGLRAARFRRFITTQGNGIGVKISPIYVSASVTDTLRFDVVITNSLERAVKVHESRPSASTKLQFGRENEPARVLPSGSDLHSVLSMRTLAPGRFQISRWSVTLEDDSGLLTHNLLVPSDVFVEVVPVIGRVETKVQLGSLANLTRFGTGSDLARIREVVSQDDFNSIDWKSTARLGKFMKKEYSPETEPSVLILVDTSMLTRWPQAIVHLGKLLVTFLTSTPVGIMLYDEQNVRDQLSPSTGTYSRLLGLRSLLSASNTPALASATQSGARLYHELVDVIALLQSTARNPPPRRVDIYAQSLLPYYETNLPRYSTDLRHRGSFRAFERVSSASPMLLIAISHPNQDVRGLCEGAVLANASGHRIILVFVTNTRDTVSQEILALQDIGIQVIQTGTADAANAIRRAIAEIPTMRIKNPRQLQYSRRA